METNTLPRYDASDNTTGCCPRFKPEGWDARTLHFRDKRFLRATSRTVMHIPINIRRVFDRVDGRVSEAGGWNMDDMIVLSRDLSPWESEHYFAVPKDIPHEEMVRLSGDYLTSIYEGPYHETKHWAADLEGMARGKGCEPRNTFFFYTTFPTCARVYGENYVVGVVEI